ncbi:MAG: flagellar basal body rod protein FlgB [Selenomonadaceae bacterium]
MLDQMLNSANFDYLGRGINAANMRQEVIAQNIANINTPLYKRSQLNFEELLQKEIFPDESNTLPLVRTNDKHLPVGHLHYHATPEIVTDNSTTMRVDRNNVDLDIEMASMAKNQIYYNAMTTQLGGYINRLRDTIQSGQ